MSLAYVFAFLLLGLVTGLVSVTLAWGSRRTEARAAQFQVAAGAMAVLSVFMFLATYFAGTSP